MNIRNLPPWLLAFVRWVWDKHANLLMAAVWITEASFIASLLLAWIPIVGPLLGPVFGGLTGGRRAGTPGRALLAALLPACLLSAVIIALGGAAAHMTQMPFVGALATLIAGAVGIILAVHNLLLFGAALAGGLMRQREDAARQDR